MLMLMMYAFLYNYYAIAIIAIFAVHVSVVNYIPTVQSSTVRLLNICERQIERDREIERAKRMNELEMKTKSKRGGGGGGGGGQRGQRENLERTYMFLIVKIYLARFWISSDSRQMRCG